MWRMDNLVPALRTYPYKVCEVYNVLARIRARGVQMGTEDILFVGSARCGSINMSLGIEKTVG